MYYLMDAAPGEVAVFANLAFPSPRVPVYESRGHVWVQAPEGIEHYD